MNSDRKKITPKKAKLTITPTRLAPLKVPLRKNLSCSSGVRPRSSTTRKRPSAIAETTKHETIRADVQP